MGAKQSRKLSHVERYQAQCDVEDEEIITGLLSQIEEGQAEGLPDNEVGERVDRSLAQLEKTAIVRRRGLVDARSRDFLDRSVEHMRSKAQHLKRPGSDDFADIDELASSLKVVAEALERYEAIAKPELTDPHPLSELATVLFAAFSLGALIDPMTQKRMQMAVRREQKAMKALAQAKDRELLTLMRSLANKRRWRSIRQFALALKEQVKPGGARGEKSPGLDTLQRKSAQFEKCGLLKVDRHTAK